jgi:hypothetical protein
MRPMRARCVAVQPTVEEQKLLRSRFVPGKTRFPIELGMEYTVLGIGFWDCLTWFEIAVSPSALISIPGFLFEITHPRPSRYWQARIRNDGAFTLWPPSFHHEYYHNDLSEGVSEAIEDFQHLRQLLDDEAMGLK